MHTTASLPFPHIAQVDPRRDSGVHLPSLGARRSQVPGSCGKVLVNAGSATLQKYLEIILTTEASSNPNNPPKTSN